MPQHRLLYKSLYITVYNLSVAYRGVRIYIELYVFLFFLLLSATTFGAHLVPI